MNPKPVFASILLATLAAAAPAGAAEQIHDPVGFGAGQRIPATLTLNFSEDGRDARITPIYSNYRPKVVFNGREVICMIRFAPEIGTIAPGESGEVNLDCKDPVSVARAGTRMIVREGRKDVGYVDIHLPPAPDGDTPDGEQAR
ncbi:hypothetical protein [Novilysobacter defluvii]|uniref:Uncharacterized protein n=1 Tax=Lysobacter defluvii IMMIB APB-9 = DSM 18482 TaxID=1385515 RepID=A0A0A0MC36_9GAMM|nr:hypothetical protein [Lysobacter defluvii]KGO99636.1 hypothetical protein N791_02815 [Lysobacter defluvii IMMIB APB-9 = DSM 18482]